MQLTDDPMTLLKHLLDRPIDRYQATELCYDIKAQTELINAATEHLQSLRRFFQAFAQLQSVAAQQATLHIPEAVAEFLQKEQH